MTSCRGVLLAVTMAMTGCDIGARANASPGGRHTSRAKRHLCPTDFSGLLDPRGARLWSPRSRTRPVRNLGRTPSARATSNQLIGDPPVLSCSHGPQRWSRSS